MAPSSHAQPRIHAMCYSVRVDEGRKGWSLLAIPMKARTLVGRGEKGLLSDPGSELRLGTEKERKRRR